MPVEIAVKAVIVMLTAGRLGANIAILFSIITRVDLHLHDVGVFWVGWFFGMLTTGALVAYADQLYQEEQYKPPRTKVFIDKDIGRDQDRHRFW